MTPKCLRNIHTTRNSRRDTLPCANMALKLSRYFYLLMEKPQRPRGLLVSNSKFGLITPNAAQCNQKHLFLYPQGDRSGLRKPKKDRQEHQH